MREYFRHAFAGKCGCIRLGRIVRRAYRVRNAVRRTAPHTPRTPYAPTGPHSPEESR